MEGYIIKSDNPYVLAKYAINMRPKNTIPFQNALKLPATSPDKIFKEGPPFLEASTTSFTCVDFGLVNIFVNSGMRAAPRVPALIMTDSMIHILFGMSPIMK